MAVPKRSHGQLSLFGQAVWRTVVALEMNQRLVKLCQSIPWDDLMEKAIPLLYNEHGISEDVGRRLDLRAHLGAYILQTVHGWTDRFSEEMIRFYIPARLFCGYLESERGLDHTSIEDFRNRLGEKGAELITGQIVGVAKRLGLTSGDDVDMDTTVQEAGITYPTEMKLMQYLLKKLWVIHAQIKQAVGRGISGIKNALNAFGKLMSEYRFFSKTKQKKEKVLRQALAIAQQALGTIDDILPTTKAFENLKNRYQLDILRLLDLAPLLLEQIAYWIDTGKVAKDKIVVYGKRCPRRSPRERLANQ
jgi:hypothetical protein